MPQFETPAVVFLAIIAAHLFISLFCLGGRQAFFERFVLPEGDNGSDSASDGASDSAS